MPVGACQLFTRVIVLERKGIRRSSIHNLTVVSIGNGDCIVRAAKAVAEHARGLGRPDPPRLAPGIPTFVEKPNRDSRWYIVWASGILKSATGGETGSGMFALSHRLRVRIRMEGLSSERRVWQDERREARTSDRSSASVDAQGSITDVPHGTSSWKDLRPISTDNRDRHGGRFTDHSTNVFTMGCYVPWSCQSTDVCKEGPLGKPESQFDPFFSSSGGFGGVAGEINCDWVALRVIVSMRALCAKWLELHPVSPTSRHRCLCFRFLGFGMVERVVREEGSRKPQRPSPPSPASCGGLLGPFSLRGMGESV